MPAKSNRRSIYISQGAVVSQVWEAVNSVLPTFDREFEVKAVVEATDEHADYDIAVRLYGIEHAVDLELRSTVSALRRLLWHHKFAIDVDLETRNEPMLISFVYPDFQRHDSGAHGEGSTSDGIALFFVECLENVAAELIERFDLRDEESRNRSMIPFDTQNGDGRTPSSDIPSSEAKPIGASSKRSPPHDRMARVPTHRPGDSERIGFRIARDLSLMDIQVLHHPYHQLYNAHSPWWALPRTRAISNLAELVDVELGAGMVPLGIVGERGWRPPGWKEGD